MYRYKHLITGGILRGDHLCIADDRTAHSADILFTIKRMHYERIRNKVQLIGHLGNAPEIRSTEAGKKLARFSVATDEIYRSSTGEKVKETQWHNLVAWGKVADIAENTFIKEAGGH